MIPPDRLNSIFGTKVQDILIEIFDYGFYHGPSEIDNLDSRFIGREEVGEKLKTILTNNETKSGTYLVTGFRGMGKTSLVNKTLADITGIFAKRIQITRYLRIIIPLFILSIINISSYPIFFSWLPLLIWILIGFYLVYSDSHRNSLKLHGTQESISEWLNAFLQNFFIEKEKVSRKRYRIIFQDIFLLLFAHLIAILGFNILEPKQFSEKFWIYFGIFIFGLITSTIFRTFKQQKGKGIKDKWSKVFRNVLDSVIHKINFSQRRIIRINLGHDELKEVDILRMIVRRMYDFYKKRTLFSIYTPINTVFRLIGIFSLYLFLSLIYFFPPLHSSILDFKKESIVSKYFPSQSVFVYANSINSEQNITTLPQEIDKWFISLEDFDFDTYLTQIALRSDFFPNRNRLRREINNDKLLFTSLYLDYYLTSTYYYLIRTFDFSNTPVSVQSVNYLQFLLGKKVHPHFAVIPPHIDYFLFIYLLLGSQIMTFTLKFRYFGMSSHPQVRKRLEILIDRLYAEITLEKEQSANFPGRIKEVTIPVFRFLSRNKKRYPIADVREIESEIISILSDIGRIPKVFLRPEFVFIFDELDKIDPQGNVSIRDKEAEDVNDKRNQDIIFSSTERIRKRQQTIIKILSNLKHFLNTAQAKFIFIAGREMFDASLADISDRDSFIGSIFHDVIYVNSFLTDASYEERPDVTSMTETYVCNAILPSKYCHEPSLQRYNKYLKEEIFVEKLNNSNYENLLIRIKREKTIVTLQHFITYLTYRSSGAPKKITRIFEQFIKTESRENLSNESKYLVIGKNHRNLYLKFNFDQQYAFGLTSYLTMPFLLTISKYTQDFGDKLLVSSSFLIDHLYKYHEFSFEWRNLELTPEIIDFNKAPELRGFINQIIQYLSNSHIQEIVSSLHDLKFNNKISAEIFYLSKISEVESAAFNFTLDESLEIKNYFNRRIRIIQQKNKFLLEKDNAEYVHALGTNLMLLGDLHYFDQEYAEAINHYHQAIHLLKTNFKRQMEATGMPNIYEFTLMIRNMLKLGLSFERKNSYDFAFLTYGEITSAILEVRFLNAQRFGLKEIEISEKDVLELCKNENFKSITPKYRNIEKGLKTSFLKRFQELWREKVKFKTKAAQELPADQRKLLVIIKDIENASYSKHRNKGTVESFEDYKDNRSTKSKFPQILGFSDEFVEVLEMLPDTFYKEDLNQRISTLEGMRLIYQPFIAKLHIIESNNLGGVTISDFRRTIDEFEFLIKLIKKEEKFLVTAEFYNKLADVFYYKNGCLDEVIKRQSELPYLDSEQDFVAPLTAYLCYFMSAQNLLLHNPVYDDAKLLNKSYEKIHTKKREINLIKTLIKGFEKEDKIFTEGISRHKYLNTFANALSELGDTALGSSNKKQVIRKEFFLSLLNLISTDIHNTKVYDRKEKIENLLSFIEPNMSILEIAFCYFFLSGHFYIHVGIHRQYAFQLTKILYVIKYFCWVNPAESKNLLDDEIMGVIENGLCKRILLGMSRAYDYSQRPELERLNKIFQGEKMPFAYLSLSISADYKEVILLFKDLQLQVNQFKPRDEKLLTNPYSTTNSKFNRVRELDIKSRQNLQIFKKLGFENILDKKDNFELSDLYKGKNNLIKEVFQKNYAPKEVIEFLITDSIYCNFEAVRILEIFGISFIDNHSLRAMTNFALAEWCQYYEAYYSLAKEEDRKSINNKIEELLSQVDLISLKSAYHYERSIQEFYLAIETHKESKAYRNIINNMYYLDDDFNDYYTHFCTSLERYRINTGKIRELIAIAKERLKSTSQIYEVKSYT